ncbi:MAG TPA: antitoxin Xre-like helix-turn-helix domain-containing protein [Opitutaceae bacterium]|nr:antitoxin Xre-like helix-turn-helix domain-containing protein [Opitutaceae bacterium]
MHILTLTEQPLSTQIAAVRKGFPSTALAQIAAGLGLSRSKVIDALAISPRTAAWRQRHGRSFTASESERLFRLVRVRRLAREVFATDAAVAEWLETPDGSLGGKAPLQMLATDLEMSRLENLLTAMIHGVPV